jgi:hypothetical protein
MIKPSHYDDDGYVIQWARSWVPSNSLAALYGLALDCIERRVLGEEVDIELSVYDEFNSRIRVERIARRIKSGGGGGLVAMVGVQTNQFPRAMDLARRFRALGVQVCIGGFHVSGSLAMLPELPDDLRDALECGVSLFAGEAEGRLEGLLRAAHRGKMKPLYDYMDDLPGIEGAPVPHLPAGALRRNAGARTSFDAGRGCPFMCSFCTIINVQGRKSRHRSADDVERILRDNLAQGITDFFITDDNFARNRNWEALLDRLIELREGQGLEFQVGIQVDTMCHKIPDFIDKCGRAGVIRVFIGLENINPDSLKGAGKGQNRITEYRAMLHHWHGIGVTTYAGYILGFPADTPESIARDIEIMQRELPVDLLEFFVLTPLPGSADHKSLHERGVAMDADMNRYDAEHVTTDHPLMSREAWDEAYRTSWERYYSLAHVQTLMRRARARGIESPAVAARLLLFSACTRLEGLHPLEGGFLRRKYRTERRPGMPVEPPVVFHLRYAFESLVKYGRLLVMGARYWRIWRRVRRESREYTDLAIAGDAGRRDDELELLTRTRGARAAVERARRRATAGADAA